LVDPNVAPVRALAREERELMIAANNGHLLAFDNLSGLPFWLSDAFCRLASGGSFAVRQLYTDDEEVLFQAARPILLNGIEDVISRPDLAFLTLPPIGEAQRRPETEVWREFDIAPPSRILGALLDAAEHGLRTLTGSGCHPVRSISLKTLDFQPILRNLPPPYPCSQSAINGRWRVKRETSGGQWPKAAFRAAWGRPSKESKISLCSGNRSCASSD
jgi:hypothetical protein